MSRFIADILQTDYLALHHALQELEHRTGKPSHDARLISDIKVTSRDALNATGLDAQTATAQEVYYALKEQARLLDQSLTEVIGVSPETPPQEMLQLCVEWVQSTIAAHSVWTLRHPYIKTALKKQPPKTVMKILGLKSVDSMLKRNNAFELLTLAKLTEKPQWKAKFTDQIRKVSLSDFDDDPIVFLQCDEARSQKLLTDQRLKGRIVIPNYETGSITLITPPSRFYLDVLAITLALVEAVADIEKHSAYFRMISVRPDFAQQMLAVVSSGITAASRAIAPHDWNTVYRHLVGNETVAHIEDHPHIDRHDIPQQLVLTRLAHAHNGFAGWDKREYAFFVDRDGSAVSMHIVDVVTNAANRRAFAERYSAYGMARLQEELNARYLQHDDVLNEALNVFFSPEDL